MNNIIISVAVISFVVAGAVLGLQVANPQKPLDPNKTCESKINALAAQYNSCTASSDCAGVTIGCWVAPINTSFYSTFLDAVHANYQTCYRMCPNADLMNHTYSCINHICTKK